MTPAGGDKSFLLHCSFPRPGEWLWAEKKGRPPMGWAEGQLGAAGGKLGSVPDQHVKPVFTCSPRRSLHHLTHPHPRSPSDETFSQELGLGAQGDLATHSAPQPTFPRARRSTPGGKKRGLDLTHPVTTGRTQTQLPGKHCLWFS